MVPQIFVIFAAPRIRVRTIVIPASIITGYVFDLVKQNADCPGVFSVSSVLYAVEPRGTNYWACEFIATLCLPWATDM